MHPDRDPESGPGAIERSADDVGADTEDVPWRTTPPRRSRWPWVALLVVALGAFAGTGYVAWTNFEAGSGWRDRAQEQQARAATAEARADELEAELGRVERQLEASEEDVALLESRLAALASEKAGAEDSAALAAEATEDLTAVTVFAAEVGGDLRTCIARNVELTNDILAAHNAGQFDPDPMNARIDSVNEFCADAESSYGELRARLDALGE